MNQLGCPDGMFTDDILVFDSIPLACDGNVRGWIGFMSGMIALRVLVLIAVWIVWFRRRKRLRNTASRLALSHPHLADRTPARVAAAAVTTRWFPLVPVVSTVDTTLQLLFFILASTNIISIQNGMSILVISLWVLTVCVIQLLALRKLVHLGSKVFKSGGETRVTANAENLTTFDRILKILVFVSVIIFFPP